MKKGISILVLLFSCLISYAQLSIKVVVVDAQTAEPLVAANIVHAGMVSTTNVDGIASIGKDLDQVTVSCSYIGYETKEQVLKSGSINTIRLMPSSTMLETMTVTASKYQQRLSESTVSIEVLDPAYISSTSASNSEEVLDKIPGVQMVDGQANIRGGSGFSYGAGSRVLLLLDDMSAMQIDAGFPNWGDLPIEATDRVEVVKGASSALYGSAALNGIINLRRIQPKSDPRTEISIAHTRYADPADLKKKWWTDDEQPQATQITAMHAQKFDKLDVLVHGFYYDLDSYAKESYENRMRLGASLAYRLSDQWLFKLSSVVNNNDNSSFFLWADPLSGIYTPYANSISSSKNLRFNIDPSIKYYASGGDVHTLRARINSINNENNNNQGNTSLSEIIEYQYETQLWDQLKWVSGASYTHASSDSDLFGDTTFTANNLAIFGQADYKLMEKLGLVAGLRYEYNHQSSPEVFNGVSIPEGKVTDGELIARLGMNYELAKYTNLRASWGQGYRFPTISERFIVTAFSGLSIFPNPQLNPEKGWTAEIGIKQGVKLLGVEGFLDVSLFHQEYQDMTEFVFVNFGSLGFQSQNVGGTQIDGVELSFMGKASLGPVDFSLFGGYTYIDPKYKDFNESLQSSSSSDENVLKYRTKHNAKADIQAEYGGFSLGLAYNRTSHMLAIDSALDLLGAPQIEAYRSINNMGYDTFNLRMGYTWREYKLSFLIDNMTNEEYTQRAGKLEAPKSYTLRVDYNLGR